MSIFALGRIAKYQLSVSFLGPLAVLIAWGFVGFGTGIVGVGLGLIVGKVLTLLVRLYFARIQCGMSIRFWICRVFAPVLMTIIVVGLIGSVPRLLLEESFLRVCVTAVCCEIALLPLMWFAVFEKSEREMLANKLIILKRFVK